MQKCFALTDNFREARHLKSSVERMKKDESRDARIRAAAILKREYDLLIERQRNDLVVWQQNWDRKRMTLETSREVELAANGKLRRQLTTRITAPKRPRKSQVFLPITARAPAGLLSQRTRSQIADYRQQPEAVRLSVTVAEVKSMVRIGPKTPRKAHQTSQ
jgi:hypothetical protein